MIAMGVSSSFSSTLSSAFLLILVLHPVLGHFFNSFDKGVDISAANGRINWKAMCSCGNLKFAFIKATEGRDHVDPFFERNFNQSVEHGLKTGLWHQFRTSERGRDVTPEEQVVNLVQAIRRVDFNASRDMIAVATRNRAVDMEEEDEEDPSLRREDRIKLSNMQMSNRLYRLMRLIKKRTGVTPLLFTNNDFWDEFFHTEERSFIEFDLWVSHHIITYNISEANLRTMSPTLPAGFAAYTLWQYTNQGYLPGVKPGSDVPVSIVADLS